MMVRRRYSAIAILAVVALAVAVPTAVNAVSYQYALNRPVDDYTTTSSATGTVAGGAVTLSGPAPVNVREVIQTYATTGTLLYQASGADGVSFNHGPVSGVRSRCYWYRTTGPDTDIRLINCWRYA
jgi:hypothetical protein